MPDRTRDLVAWLDTIGPPRVVVLACEHSPELAVARDAVGLVVSGCLGDHDIGLPAQVLALGAGSVRVLPCPNAPDRVADLVTEWAEVLPDVRMEPGAVPVGLARRGSVRRGSVRRGPVMRVDGSPPPKAGLVSRRRLLRLGLPTAGDRGLDLLDDERTRTVAALRILRASGRARLDADDAGPVFGGARGAAELLSVSGVASPAPEEPGSVESPALTAVASPAPEEPGPVESQSCDARPEVLVAQGCVACGVCVAACPNDALRLDSIGSSTSLRHDRDTCTGERACVTMCPIGALAALGAVSVVELAARPVVELSRVETAPCTRCGARHPAAEGDLCPPCHYRRSHPFGSRITFQPLW